MIINCSQSHWKHHYMQLTLMLQQKLGESKFMGANAQYSKEENEIKEEGRTCPQFPNCNGHVNHLEVS